MWTARTSTLYRSARCLNARDGGRGLGEVDRTLLGAGRDLGDLVDLEEGDRTYLDSTPPLCTLLGRS